jgi:hypothetical protein
MFNYRFCFTRSSRAIALLTAGTVFTLGCKSKDSTQGVGQAASAAAAIVSTAAQVAAAATSANPAAAAVPAKVGPPPNLKLTEFAPIPGTPVSLTLPPDFKRVGRSLLFRSSDKKDPVTVRLVLAKAEGRADGLLLAALNIYKMNSWFVADGPPQLLASSREEAAFATGKMNRDAGGLVTQESPGLMAAFVKNGLLVSVLISHPPGKYKIAKTIAESVLMDTALPLDPQLAYGVSYQIPAGFHLGPVLFEPLYFYPVGSQTAPVAGPVAELRFRQADELERTFDEMMPAFLKDVKTAQCSDIPGSEILGAVPGKPRGRDCSFVADTPERFNVRLWGVKDDLGAVIAIVRTPLMGAEAQSSGFDAMLKSLQFGSAQPAAVTPAAVLPAAVKVSP